MENFCGSETCLTSICPAIQLRPKGMSRAKNTFPSGSRTWDHSVRCCALYQLSHDAAMTVQCDGFELYLPCPPGWRLQD
ncbi:Leukocyte immunoglobulin-like receptor subfamily A member 3, partial [Frankliniella fusca]